MTSQATAVVQVVGRLGAADPVAATARSWQARLDRMGLDGAVLAPDGPGIAGRPVLVHSSDGGAGLVSLVPRLEGRVVTLVHHGSEVGSDRHGLRSLRSHTGRALAADAAAREELRALGFTDVRPLDPALADLDPVEPDPATVEALGDHPAARILFVGPIEPHRGIEAILDAFDALLTHQEPAAVLSLCGPSAPWYRQRLHRTITTRGLLACEVVEPRSDAEVVARLHDAAAMVAIRPRALDPYLRCAVGLGLPVVAPLVEATEWVPPGTLVPVPDGGTPRDLAGALAEGIARRRATSREPDGPGDPPPSAADGDRRLSIALGLR